MSVYIIFENMLCLRVISVLETSLLALSKTNYIELECSKKSLLTLSIC